MLHRRMRSMRDGPRGSIQSAGARRNSGAPPQAGDRPAASDLEPGRHRRSHRDPAASDPASGACVLASLLRTGSERSTAAALAGRSAGPPREGVRRQGAVYRDAKGATIPSIQNTGGGMVQLKDFVKSTLIQIAQGVAEAQEEAAGLGAFVNPIRLAGTSGRWDRDTANVASTVEFDVAVQATEGTSTKSGIGVAVASLVLGTQVRADESAAATSRIKFSVDILLPPGRNPLPRG